MSASVGAVMGRTYGFIEDTEAREALIEVLEEGVVEARVGFSLGTSWRSCWGPDLAFYACVPSAQRLLDPDEIRGRFGPSRDADESTPDGPPSDDDAPDGVAVDLMPLREPGCGAQSGGMLPPGKRIDAVADPPDLSQIPNGPALRIRAWVRMPNGWKRVEQDLRSEGTALIEDGPPRLFL